LIDNGQPQVIIHTTYSLLFSIVPSWLGLVVWLVVVKHSHYLRQVKGRQLTKVPEPILFTIKKDVDMHLLLASTF